MDRQGLNKKACQESTGQALVFSKQYRLCRELTQQASKHPGIFFMYLHTLSE
jgi:hypothetical protein